MSNSTDQLSKLHCNQPNELTIDYNLISRHEKQILWVIIFSTLMMLVEIVTGYLTGSMALLADGYHMASHAGALGIAYLVYRLTKSANLNKNLSFGTGKLLPLGGYSSAILLGIISLWMMIESIFRLFLPVIIKYNEAIAIAFIGLIINLISAFLLGYNPDHSHKHNHSNNDSSTQVDHFIEDHNHRSAIMHILADALTSVTAIIALLIGKFFHTSWVDPAIGILGSLVILQWSYSICKTSAMELLDVHSKEFPLEEIKAKIEINGYKVLDLHVWKIGPGNHVCQLIVQSPSVKGSEYYKEYFKGYSKALHLVVEERSNNH